MATYADAVDAIESRLRDMWSLTPVAFENDKRPSIAGPDGLPAPWIYCEVMTVHSGIKGVGNVGRQLLLDTGNIEITVFTPRDEGRSDAREIAIAVAAIFDREVFADDGAGSYVRSWVPVIGPGNFAKSENPSGSWWAVSVMTPFEFYRIG